MARYAAAIDQGTTGTRFMVFGHDGKVVASAYQEHRQIYPQPGWVEHDPLEIWQKTCEVTGAAMAQAGLAASDLAAIGITNQRETALVWDRRTGEPVYNAIVWQDTRTREICQALIDEGFEEVVRQRAGLVVATYFSGPKVQWILDHVEGARARAERGELLFGNVDTWLIWWLTGGPRGGVHVTDYTNASRTMLMNLRQLDWDPELLARLRVPRAMLPEIRPSSDAALYGHTGVEGLPAGVPVCADLGDQQAAVFGQTCYDVGEAKNTYGTGNFMLLNTGSQAVPSKSGLLTTAAYGLESGTCIYALEGSIAITGAAVQWLRDNLGLIADAAETERLAGEVEDSGGAYFVPAFSGLFAPYWDMYARGAIVGLTRYVDRRHLVRATLESICYQTRDVGEAMEADSGIELRTLKVDGGATRNDLLMQLQADILGKPVVRPTVSETTALGAAYAAGLAVGFWKSLDELRSNWQVDRTWEPTWPEDRREEGYRQWKKAVERTRAWVDR
ncbi:MAG TPA: glycerol kinase GlpK [Candidatus Dormibacteraeota bacterium]|jgi:glycerol kinase|nr:glycerol kinase GlpK [Candidatus Dormibacteraeota bacterium]